MPSGFDDWLAARRAKGNYLEYDGDAAFAQLEERLLRGAAFPLAVYWLAVAAPRWLFRQRKAMT